MNSLQVGISRNGWNQKGHWREISWALTERICDSKHFYQLKSHLSYQNERIHLLMMSQHRWLWIVDKSIMDIFLGHHTRLFFQQINTKFSGNAGLSANYRFWRFLFWAIGAMAPRVVFFLNLNIWKFFMNLQDWWAKIKYVQLLNHRIPISLEIRSLPQLPGPVVLPLNTVLIFT